MKNDENVYTEPTPPRGRRDFLTYILGGGLVAWAASVLYPIFAYLKPPRQAEVEVKTVNAGPINGIERDGAKIIRFGTKPVIVIRTRDGEFRAFDGTCTHLDCTVQYRKDLSVIWCACHNGQYDLNGRNIAGPPPRPLEEYKVVIQADEILVAKKTSRT